MNQSNVPVSAPLQSTSKLTPVTMLVCQQIAVPLGALERLRKILEPVVAQVVDTVTAVVPLAVTLPMHLEAAVAS